MFLPPFFVSYKIFIIIIVVVKENNKVKTELINLSNLLICEKILTLLNTVKKKTVKILSA